MEIQRKEPGRVWMDTNGAVRQKVRDGGLEFISAPETSLLQQTFVPPF